MNEKRLREAEKKIEKTNERISICIGAGIAMIAVVTAGGSLLVSTAVVAMGGVIGLGAHHTRKWMKNRKK